MIEGTEFRLYVNCGTLDAPRWVDVATLKRERDSSMKSICFTVVTSIALISATVLLCILGTCGIDAFVDLRLAEIEAAKPTEPTIIRIVPEEPRRRSPAPASGQCVAERVPAPR